MTRRFLAPRKRLHRNSLNRANQVDDFAMLFFLSTCLVLNTRVDFLQHGNPTN
ncbi:hypothetical protein RSSM_00210 [Rhodopirellula sallentina SM41]|uniref:Uncharacterized protein n=1 Tax=Rhodopirellula sallentina SM41 TaxID=1263870 RepID=M5UAA8_9BACT|nr:hypothetical protein RSSM_00210 [Rhodopirellula sallentina SM41]